MASESVYLVFKTLTCWRRDFSIVHALVMCARLHECIFIIAYMLIIVVREGSCCNACVRACV